MSKRMRKESWLIATLLAGVSVPALADNNTYIAQCTFHNKLITITISADANNENSTVFVDAGRGPAGFTSVNGTHKQQYDGNGGAGHMIYENNTATQWYVAPQYSTRYQSSVMLNGKWYPMQCGGFQYTVVAGANDPPAQAYAPTYAPTQDPPMTYAPQPNVTTIIPALSASGTDSVTITMYPEGTNLQSVDITLGNSTPARVLVDTGASILNIKESLGNALIASGEATVLKTIESTIADGSTITERMINISQITIGGHTLYNIKATVGPENAMMLLGMEILNRFSKFSIDTGHNQLILG